MPEVLTRPAVPADAPAIARVHVSAWQTAYRGIISDQAIASRSVERREGQWSEWLADPGTSRAVFVADVDGRIVGFASGGPERDGLPGYDGELYAIYLLAEHRRNGIGLRLTARVVHWLIARHMHSMVLWVLAANPACAFYEVLGGQIIAQKMANIGGDEYPEVAYGWPNLAAWPEGNEA